MSFRVRSQNSLPPSDASPVRDQPWEVGEGHFHPPPPDVADRKDSARCWGSTGPGGGLGAGAAVWSAAGETSPDWVSALAVPPLALTPRTPRGHAVGLGSHLKGEAGARAAVLTAPGLCSRGNLDRLFSACSPSPLPGPGRPPWHRGPPAFWGEPIGNQPSVPHRHGGSVFCVRMAPRVASSPAQRPGWLWCIFD